MTPLQRRDGAAEVAYAAGPNGAVLAYRYQREPCCALFPDSEPGDPPQAVFITTAGGLNA